MAAPWLPCRARRGCYGRTSHHAWCCADPFFTIPFDHNGGYYYGDTFVRFFSHTHMVGAGIVVCQFTGGAMMVVGVVVAAAAAAAPGTAAAAAAFAAVVGVVGVVVVVVKLWRWWW
jgi:hypothetical protein